MAPSTFSNQAGGRRDHHQVATTLQGRFANAPPEKAACKHRGAAGSNAGRGNKGAAYGAPEKNRGNNIIADLVHLVAGLAGRRDAPGNNNVNTNSCGSSSQGLDGSTPSTTPLTTGNWSSGDEADPAGEVASLERRWDRDSNTQKARPPLANTAGGSRTRPIPIDIGRNRTAAGRQMISADAKVSTPQSDRHCCQGRLAGDPKDEGGGESDRFDGEEKGASDGDKIGAWKRACHSKRVSFTEETFVPCYATFTPHISSECFQEMKYKAPETRVPSAVAPPSSVARPNYHDALRRVAVVVYQHIKTCEWRRKAAEEKERAAAAEALQNMSKRPTAPMQHSVGWHRSAPSLVGLQESALWGEGGWEAARRGGGQTVTSQNASAEFNAHQAEVFHQKHFVSPTFRYKFVHAPVMALPGAVFTLREVKSTPKPPTVDEIYEFIKTLFNKACLSSECSLVCLIYVERLMESAHVPLLASTWKPILLCGLLLASKVWQDLSSWNVEFSTVYPEYSLKSINRLELLFLGAMRWDMSISSSLYAKYYFALRSLAEKKDFRRRYNQVMQIDAPRANRVQERADAVKLDVIHTKPVCMLSKSL